MDSILLQIIPFALLLFFVSLWIWSGIWISRDAQRRGKPGLLVAILALFLAWPVSLLVWLALRPENVRPRFDLNRFRVQ